VSSVYDIRLCSGLTKKRYFNINIKVTEIVAEMLLSLYDSSLECVLSDVQVRREDLVLIWSRQELSLYETYKLHETGSF
jgi:hypothetical protein